ncbi:MAG: PTS sugar transporter subunit IIA, partial [Pseudomonadota bacterium]|nr:PTS sugar transporter subunit IIA [Pseudomonadota bacterium]
MELTDLITPDHVIARMRATRKKQALPDLARRSAEVSGLEQREIFDILLERERLGTTGIGRGIAIPHGKHDRLNGL